jgi:hypothetical protein
MAKKYQYRGASGKKFWKSLTTCKTTKSTSVRRKGKTRILIKNNR